MASILCLWKYKNYLKDKIEGLLEVVPSFNSNQSRLHSVTKLGDRAYVVTYNKGRGYLIGRITIASKEQNPPGHKYGKYRIAGKPSESQYFDYESIDVTEVLVDILQRSSKNKKRIPKKLVYPIAQYFQTLRELTESDTMLLESCIPKEEKGVRNPKWTRDELILALELYFRVNPLHTSEKHREIVNLSELLNSLPIHAKSEHVETFRNPTGVYMKLCNFLRFDPDYGGKGLNAGSKLDEVVWDEFYSDRIQLAEIAAAIRRNHKYVAPPHSEMEEAEPIDEEEEFPEGRILFRVHRQRERSYRLVEKKKGQILRSTGTLACEACSFDFAEFYGEIGCGFAECHHNRPLSQIHGEQSIGISELSSELSIVCPNCHRMIHKTRPWLTVLQLKDLLVGRGKLSA